MAYSSFESLFYGDGAGGKMSLDIQKGVLNFIIDSGHTYKTATAYNTSNIHAGKVVFKVPEMLQVQDYDNKTNWKWQTPQAADIEIVLDKRRLSRVELEHFDNSRLGEWEYVITMITNTLGLLVVNDLNASFYNFLAKAFDPTTGEYRPATAAEALVLPELVQDGITPDEAKTVIYKLNREFTKINKTFNKNVIGIPKASLNIFLDPYADTNIRQAFWNQPNSLGERTVAKDLTGHSLGGDVTYFLDKMIGTKIDAGASFNGDYAVDTTKFAGFIIHNEAIAMPFNFEGVFPLTNPETANPRILLKYQFGIGFLRPWLVKPIYLAAPTPKTTKGK